MPSNKPLSKKLSVTKIKKPTKATVSKSKLRPGKKRYVAQGAKPSTKTF